METIYFPMLEHCEGKAMQISNTSTLISSGIESWEGVNRMYQIGFVVNEQPYCVCEWDLPKRNLRFLESIDPTYFRYVSDTNVSRMNVEDEKTLQHAAISLRIVYSQGLETLFAFIFATIQAPDCVAGWLLKYSVRDITELLEKVRNRKPVISFLGTERPTWKDIASAIFQFNEEERFKYLIELYSKLWQAFSSDYLSENFDTEYNNIKHGFRVRSGGFSLAMGAQDQPGVSAKQMFLVGKSEYGSTFFIPEKIGNTKAHFRIKYTSRNWDVERFIVGLQLIELSLSNILACLRIANGVKPEEVEFVWPTNTELLDKFYQMHPSVSHWAMDNIVQETDIKAMSKEDILKRYAKKS
jgi:hypothetical protein